MDYKYELPTGWDVAEAQEFCLKVADGTHDSPKQVIVGKPLVTSKNIIGGRLDLNNTYNISDDDFAAINKRSKVDVNDVLFSMIGTVGQACLIIDEPDFAIKNVGLLKNDNPYKAKWLYFYLTSPQAQALIKERLRGSTQQYLPLGEIRKFPIPYPSDTDELKDLVDFLWGLHSKIELNRQINQTLEQIAQAIFKSWFVDFEPVKAKVEAKAAGRDPELAAMCTISGKSEAELDQLPPAQYQQLAATADLFPDELVESELGLIPEGWEVSTLKELTVKIGSGATPRGGSGVYLHEGTALIRSQNVYDSEFVWDGLARISDSAAKQLSGVEVKQDDVLLNITGASILRTCVVVPNVLPARVNQHVAIIRAKAGIPARYIHLNLLQQKTKDFLMGLNAGASREAVTKGHIESVPTLKPSPEVLACFGAATDSVYSEVEQLASQTRTLATLRDTLLPKLLSGEIEIKDVANGD